LPNKRFELELEHKEEYIVTRTIALKYQCVTHNFKH